MEEVISCQFQKGRESAPAIVCPVAIRMGDTDSRPPPRTIIVCRWRG
jgi:hypothetical protein